MARKRQPEITQACSKGLEMLDEIREICLELKRHLPRAHGNEKIHDEMVFGGLLCAFFEPACRSQRTIDQLSEVPGVKELLEGNRLARGTLSDALARFDVPSVRHVIRMLRRRLPQLKQQDPTLELLTGKIIAGDGSSFHMAGEVAWALKRHKDREGTIDSQAKLHLQLDVRRWTMENLRVTGASQSPQGGSEQAMMAQMLEKGVTYLLDRGYCGFDLLGRILAANSHVVLRMKKDWTFRPSQDLPLSEKDKQAGIGSDQLGLVGMASEDLRPGNKREHEPPEQVLRLVQVWDPGKRQWVLLLTDLVGLEGWVIGYLYRCRWVIELFFRWLKMTAGFAHLISESPNGVQAQMYVGMIGTLLIFLHTKLPPSKYSLLAIGMVASGRASFKDMLPGLLRLTRERMLERERLAKKKAQAKA